MPTRLDQVRTLFNDSSLYSKTLEDRGVKYIEQYPSNPLKEVTTDIRLSLNKVYHTWKAGDKLFALSNNFYDDPRYWGLIAWFNNKPTEQHIEIGEVIEIPTPLNIALSFYYGG